MRGPDTTVILILGGEGCLETKACECAPSWTGEGRGALRVTL